MPRIETSQATHIPARTKWLPDSTPKYHPTSEGAPQLPKTPRAPHHPHFRHTGRIAVAALSLAMIGVTAEGALRPNTPDPIARAGEIPAEQMRYPWDAGNVHLELQYTEIGQDTFEFSGAQITSDPATLNIGDGKYIQFVLGSEYGDNDNPYGHIKIELTNDVMKGGIWEKSVDAEGNTILNPNGEPILNQFGHEEQIPNQASQPVIS